MSENMQFPIPNSILEPYIKTAVASAITASLGDGTELVGKAVQAALMQKVNAQGRVDQYSSYNTYNYVEVVAAEKIREIASVTIHEMAEGMRPSIKASVEKQIAKQGNIIAKTMVEGLIESLKTSWNVNVKIEPKPTDR